MEFMRQRLPWPPRHRRRCHVPYGANDPLYEKDIGFYLFSRPAYVVIKNWMPLTLFLSALFAGAVYWVHGDIEYNAQRRSMSPAEPNHKQKQDGANGSVDDREDNAGT